MKNIPNPKSLFICILTTCVATICVAQKKEITAKPNIIIFLADDMGYGDAGFTGAKDILTPNLDKLAAGGVVFKQGYANHPFCGPSRAALLSGRYPYRFGFETNPAYDPANPLMGISPTEKLFPARLQEAGYTTAAIGKWHLGASEPFHPNKRGFDYFYGFLGGGHDYFKIDLTEPVWEAYKQALVRNNKPAEFEGYLTTALSRDAANFVEKNKEKPFFMYVAYNAPHMPLQAPAEDIARYAHITDKKRRVYAAMVDVMDRGIGEVIASLKKNNIYDNTLIFFLSDNGGPLDNGSTNTPFRGRKGDFYDGGVHVPFIASWPAKIAAGTIVNNPVHSLDIARTAVEVASGNALTSPAMEGVDLMPFILGKKKEVPHESLFWRGGNGNNWSILSSDGTKYLKQGKNTEMFFLPKDIAETSDISSQNAEKGKKLYGYWNEWNKSNIDCMMIGYKEYHKMRSKFFEDAVPSKSKTKDNTPNEE